MKFTKNDNCPSPDSAEGKALDRLRDLDNPDQWVIADERKDKIDLEALDRKIKESGYLDSIDSVSTDEEIRELSEIIEDICLGQKAQNSKQESGLLGSDRFMAELKRFMNDEV